MKIRIIGIAIAVVLAVAGGAVLAVYVGGADTRALAGTRPVKVYVATTEIPSRTSGADVSRYLAIRSVPGSAAVPGRVENLADVADQVTNAAIEPGEQLLSGRFSAPEKLAAPGTALVPAGTQAVTLKLPLQQALGGTLKTGDRVGVVVVSKAGTTQPLKDVLVVSVQQGVTTAATASATASAPVDTELVTLALSGTGLTTVVEGQQNGTVWLTLPASSGAGAR